MNEHKKNYGLMDLYLRWPLIFSAFWVLVIAGTVWKAPGTAAFLAAVTVVYLCAAGWLYLTRKTTLRRALEQYLMRGRETSSRLFEELPEPYCVVDENGNVLWGNLRFREITANDRSAAGNIIQMFPNIEKEYLTKKDMTLRVHSDYQGRQYVLDLHRTGADPEGELLPLLPSDSCVTAVYMRDETEEEELRKALDHEHIVLGLIYIDNYEEVLEQIEEVRRSLLTALIDRKINRYISTVSGLTKKIEKDKYFFIMKEQFLGKMLDDRFSILDEVKQVNIGNELAITLSIGVGYGAESYTANYEFARTSIDMALGRGGDQAVVKSSEKFTYFGGKSQTQEKTTRVKARVKAQAFQELMDGKDKVLIMGHKNSDVDCLGASTGVYRMATALGKRAYIVQNSITAPILPLKERFLNNEEYPQDMFITGPEALDKVDDGTVLVIVDCNRPSIIDEPELLRKCKTIVVFDHHRSSSETVQGAVLSYCEPYASSTCEMIAEMLQYVGEGVRVKSAEADCMYGGIVIDSQEFTVQTGVRTFEAAAYLRRCGADITRVRKIFRENLNDYKSKAEVISRAQIYRDCYAFSTVTAKGLESPTVIAAQAANELLNIRGIKASIVLTQYNNLIYVSARSIDELNVQVLMEKLGGGGHRTIAGAQLSEGSMEEAIESIKEAIDEMIKEGEVS